MPLPSPKLKVEKGGTHGTRQKVHEQKAGTTQKVEEKVKKVKRAKAKVTEKVTQVRINNRRSSTVIDSCNKRGHSARFCPELGRACHKCGVKGHPAKLCPGTSWGVKSVEEGAGTKEDASKGKAEGTCVVSEDYTIDLGGGCYCVRCDDEGYLQPVMSESRVKPAWRVGEGSHWKVKMIVDSGAVTSVVPTNLVPGINYTETEKTRQGLHYRVANGGRVPNRGEVAIEGTTAEGQGIKLKGQVTDVEKPFISTKEIVLAGNRIVHELNNDYIENVRTGKRVRIDNVGGEYTITVQIPKAREKPTFAGLVERWA